MKISHDDYGFTPEERAALTREAFDAYALVGFLKWKREEIEHHGTPPEEVESERESYVSLLKQNSWSWFQASALKAADAALLDVRQDWTERANAMALLDRQGKLTVLHVHEELRRYTGGTYPKAAPEKEGPPRQKRRDFEMGD